MQYLNKSVPNWQYRQDDQLVSEPNPKRLKTRLVASSVLVAAGGHFSSADR
jgi:hypothetical protein